MRAPFLSLAVLCAVGCGAAAVRQPPATTPAPPPGVFNGTLAVRFETDRPAKVYVSLDGGDPRQSAIDRVSGPSPFEVTLSATSTLRYYASEGGLDEPLREGAWVRAGGPPGTISGVVVVGPFSTGQVVGVALDGQPTSLATPAAPAEVPFFFEGLGSGAHRLFALADRTGDGQLTPLLDYQSATATVELDLADPFKASAEGLRLYLGASPAGLGNISGVITLPKPPLLQGLQVTALSPDAILAGFDAQALLQQLQAGYRLATLPTVTEYPYVLTDLKPGRYLPSPALIGFGAGGAALNFLLKPLSPVTVVAGATATSNFAFGPVTLTGAVTVPAASAPTGFVYGVVAARAASLADGLQAVLMPVLFTRDATTQALSGAYAGEALRGNASVALRVFLSGGATGTPLTDAVAWVVNPFAAQPPHVTVQTGTADVAQDIAVP